MAARGRFATLANVCTGEDVVLQMARPSAPGKGYFVSITATDLPLAPDRPVMPTRTMRYFALASIFTRSVK
jgi:hypothetical protein